MRFNRDSYELRELNLQFFAKDGPGGEKTEPASQRKLDEARKEGQVAKSKELVTAFSLMTLFLLIKYYAGTVGKGFMDCFRKSYALIDTLIADRRVAPNNNLLIVSVRERIVDILLLLLPVLLATFIVAFVVNKLQFKWKVTSKPMQPKLSKLNPLSGFKRIFSVKQVIELLKSIAMLAVVAYVVYSTVMEKYHLLFTLYDISVLEAVQLTGGLIVDLGIKISSIFIVIGFVDLFYQKFKFKEDMKMTKQETKDEYKQTEGDPQIKGQIRRRMQEASRRRMMQQLPQADVVITNPTHFAVAIKYDAEVSRAP
ncbi:MAG: EscU/YscU/HrcU family type III secretion system export apparatus switch protein, partial [Alistipes sp.]|nr:EscU/YscU/HrcU family type III secretion system export apparatus switch protein [Alistipes sp.]